MVRPFDRQMGRRDTHRRHDRVQRVDPTRYGRSSAFRRAASGPDLPPHGRRSHRLHDHSRGSGDLHEAVDERARLHAHGRRAPRVLVRRKQQGSSRRPHQGLDAAADEETEMTTIPKSLAISVGLFALGVATTACSSSKPTPPQRPVLELWGELKPVVSVKELMRDMLDPASDYVFEAVKTVVTKEGIIETEPKTDKDWEKIRIGAVTLAEGAYLLKIPRPFAPAGDENNSTGPDSTELSPAQIKAKLEADPVLWNAKIEALRNVGLEVLDIVKRKDVKELWDAGENLDQACESCHLIYWYPGDKALLERLDRSLEKLSGQQGDKTGRRGTPGQPPK